MNRNAEYEALLAELAATPPELDTTVDRALERRRAERRKRRCLFGIPAGSLAACFAAFVLLVNLFPTFAYACGGVPLLRELAKAVAWSPSLSAAVENQYVQPIEQSQTVNGITATIQYVIVDQKQVNIFFTLEGDYDNLSAEMPEFSPDQHCSVMGASYREPPGTLLQYTMDYVDEDVPDGFTMTFGVTTYADHAEPEEGPAPAADSSIFSDGEEEEPDILAKFSFDLRFDPTYTAQGERIPVNQTVSLDGQSITITEAEVYPTHVRINVTGDEANTAWLKRLDFYLENEDGERFEPIGNGISATGDVETPAMISYRLESPYFSRCEHLTLHITGATWLDKDMERVRIDLVNQTAEALPQGVELFSAERQGKGWIVQFSAPEEEEGHFHQIFSMAWWDADGVEHEMGSRSTMMEPYFEGVLTEEEERLLREQEGRGRFFEVLPLEGCDEEEVWLEPVYSRITQEAVPVTIAIK